MKYPMVCCSCLQKRRSRNLVCVEKKALTPGQGWGCAQCGLPSDGALAAICDECARNPDMKIQKVFDGFVNHGALLDIGELPNIPHRHNMALHPEVGSPQ